MSEPDPAEDARRLAVESLTENDPTGWFERLYAAAEQGQAGVPWDRGGPNQLLVQWAEARGLEGDGRRALVVGCGLGDDAEHVAGLGFDTVAFDVSPTAVRTARRRFPKSRVEYLAADLLDPPVDWADAFDLVVESLTIQSLPESLRRKVIDHVRGFVGRGGTLIVIAAARDEHDPPPDGPPWPLTRADIEAFPIGGLETVQIEEIRDPDQPEVRRWRAEFRRLERGR